MLSQFVDDTRAYLTYNPIVLDSFCNTLGEVERNLGLKVSYHKTCLYRIGSLRNSSAKCYTTKDLTWCNASIETLGVSLLCDGLSDPSNFEKVIQKLDTVCSDWRHRNLTLMGRVLVVNTLMSSLFVYKMTTMLDLTEPEMQLIEKRIHGFLWKGKMRGQISMQTLKWKREDGGLQLVDIKAKQQAIKIQNIFRLDPLVSECMYNSLVYKLRDLIWRCNLKEADVPKLFVNKNNFSVQTLQAWCKVNYGWAQTKADIMNQIIWFNSDLRIQGRPVWWEHW